jgi:indolepyruvate ferredoxin oxidoreductase beta subunit
MGAGLSVRGSETIGMAQRGGSVASHVRMGGAVFSPLIMPGEADIIIGFEPGETARAARYLSPTGIAVACDRAVQPPEAISAGAAAGYSAAACIEWMRKNIAAPHIVDGEALVGQIGARCLNVALIGVAIGLGALPFGAAGMESAIRRRLPEKHVEMNIEALRRGMALASENILNME